MIGDGKVREDPCAEMPLDEVAWHPAVRLSERRACAAEGRVHALCIQVPSICQTLEREKREQGYDHFYNGNK